jgi:hypothetical protein
MSNSSDGISKCFSGERSALQSHDNFLYFLRSAYLSFNLDVPIISAEANSALLENTDQAQLKISINKQVKTASGLDNHLKSTTIDPACSKNSSNHAMKSLLDTCGDISPNISGNDETEATAETDGHTISCNQEPYSPLCDTPTSLRTRSLDVVTDAGLDIVALGSGRKLEDNGRTANEEYSASSPKASTDKSPRRKVDDIASSSAKICNVEGLMDSNDVLFILDIISMF